MSTVTDEPLPRVPAPWLFTGSSWVIPLHTPFSETPIPLPAGSYAPFEAGSTADLSRRYHGGVGLVLVLRYDHSDVGPYDELILIPGLFSNEHEGEGVKYDWAITRIIVSSDKSTVNGRPEWGMPKHRGVFSFTPSPSSSSSTLITVAHPTSPDEPYFRTVLPLPAALGDAAVGEAKLAQLRETAQRLDAFVACPEPLRVDFAATGRCRICVVEPAPYGEGERRSGGDKLDDEDKEREWAELGDGVGFPRVKPLSRVANFHLTRFSMELAKGVVVKLKL
ncbi:uncharacterized protein RHOBADRAFT_44083 [Rhodotorula graminis WP1]|uniref:Acetoacetate decarboxylase n=1 Tax=Rhodotorula graminis (strain WP1) TaxID=578459 RepID=A0A194S842_RHOGW|nr:uncharacterized protein RHOBADRAFT_44083 [Rhodotorula graminis WP1]KPV75576.1 hypothetical protein RHOBADRAFT_44083 [Rhodotorula graminis WP1]